MICDVICHSSFCVNKYICNSFENGNELLCFTVQIDSIFDHLETVDYAKDVKLEWIDIACILVGS